MMELTNTNILTLLNCYEAHDVMRLAGKDVSLFACPCSILPELELDLCLAQGAQTVVLEEVSVAGIVDAISRYRVNSLVLVPAVILMLVQHAELYRPISDACGAWSTAHPPSRKTSFCGRCAFSLTRGFVRSTVR